MGNRDADAFVFFGATGDLAYKKIFPALHDLTRSGRLDVPVVGVARGGWNLERLRERARESVERHGSADPDAFEKFPAFSATSEATTTTRPPTRRSGRNWATRSDRCTTSRFSRALRNGRGTAHDARCDQGARVVVEKPFGRDLASAGS